MPKSQLDWLGVISLWIGAVIMAVKAADFSLVEGAPTWLSANWWNYVPLVLISLYVAIAIYRKLVSVDAPPQPRTAEVERIEAAPAKDPEREERRERQRVIQSLDYAQRYAAGAFADASSSGRERAAERVMPDMKAALLSGNKVFGIPIPPQGRGAVIDLELGRRMIEKILPLLREGHPEEARREAEAYLDKTLNRKPEEGKA